MKFEFLTLLAAYRHSFQWLHCIISVHPQDYGARWWLKQIADLKLCDFADCVINKSKCMTLAC